jgi:hypothetical protein
MEAQLNLAPTDLWLQLKVDVWLAVVKLEDRPHQVALGMRERGPELGECLVFAEEEELAGFQRAVGVGHGSSLACRR